MLMSLSISLIFHGKDDANLGTLSLIGGFFPSQST